MSVTFTKLFSSITESTVWCEPAHTRLVWITMLAMADRKGRVWASIPGLANRARVPLEDCEKALETLLSPDRYSRTPDHDGRRIAPIDGGWVLLNHAKYRDMRDEEIRAEQNREAQARYRLKVSKSADNQPASAQAEAYTEADSNTKNISLAGARHPSVDISPVVQTLPLRDGSEFEVRQSLVAELEPCYPSVDIPATLKEMRGWLIGHPDRRKTRRGAKAFIVRWLQTTQDSANGA